MLRLVGNLLAAKTRESTGQARLLYSARRDWANLTGRAAGVPQAPPA
jgi:hypothetical protein